MTEPECACARELAFTGRRPLRKFFRDLEKTRLRATLEQPIRVSFPRYGDGQPFQLDVPRRGAKSRWWLEHNYWPLKFYRDQHRRYMKARARKKRKEGKSAPHFKYRESHPIEAGVTR